MLLFSEVVSNMIDAWPFWLVVSIFAAIVWKMPKHKGKRSGVNQADIANKDFLARVNGQPQSNGLISPVFLSNNHNRDKF
jgi:hypothetical protein